MKNICGTGDWLSLVSRVSCFVIREAVERSSRIGVARAGWVCSVFLVFWRGPGRGGGDSGPGEPGGRWVRLVFLGRWREDGKE